MKREITFEEVKNAQKIFLETIHKRFSQIREDPDWFTGVGIGMSYSVHHYELHIHVKTQDDIHKAEEVIKISNINVPYVIEVTGVITAL